MPDRNQTPADPGTAFQLGKIEGQLRELIHTQNNQTMKGDAVAEKISKLEGLPDDIADIKAGLQRIDGRVALLEKEQHRRDGRDGLWNSLLRSPVVAWIFAAAVVAWTWLKGHGQ
jgi:hypothetical protein